MKRGIAQLIFLIGAAAALFDASAQTYPNRPITFIWPFPAGTANGEAFRVLATETGKILGQPMITEFRGGAGSRLGALAVSKAPPDGYLLGAAIDPVLTVLPYASSSFRIEPVRDYAPVLLASESYTVMSGHPSLPFRDVKGLVEYAKANPGKLNFASSGVGSTAHLAWERFMAAAGIQLTHIPYKGTAAALPDRLSGATHLNMGGIDIKPFIQSGKLIAIATTGPRRAVQLPEVPTLEESGYTGLIIKAWVAILAPPGTPAQTLARLNAAFNAALKLPEVRKAMDDGAWIVTGSTSADLLARIKADTEAYAPLVKRLGLNLD